MITNAAAFFLVPSSFEEISWVKGNCRITAVKSVEGFGCRRVSMCVCVHRY